MTPPATLVILVPKLVKNGHNENFCGQALQGAEAEETQDVVGTEVKEIPQKLNIVKDLLIKEKGGGWHKGLAYGPYALSMMVDVFEIWKVGTGENIFTQLDFPKQRVYFTNGGISFVAVAPKYGQ